MGVHVVGLGDVRRVLLRVRVRGAALKVEYGQTGPRRSWTGWMAHERATPDRSIDVVVEVNIVACSYQFE